MNLEWWKQLPKVLRTGIGGFTLVLGAFISTTTAWPHIEPYVYAHRQYVREHVKEETTKLKAAFDPTRLGLVDIQTSIVRSRRAAVIDRIRTLEVEVARSNNEEEIVKKRQQIETLKEEREEIDEELKTLRDKRNSLLR